MIRVVVIIVCYIPALVIAAEHNELKKQFYIGTARELDSGEFLYWEEHTEYYHGHQHLFSKVDYRTANGVVFANKKIDFSRFLVRPDFRLEDARDGYVEGVKVWEDSIELFLRRTGAEIMHSKVVVSPYAEIIDGGFDYFIRMSWEQLEQGLLLPFRFAVPNKLKHFGFRVRKERDLEYQGRSAVEIYLEPSNFIVRLLVEPIIVVYDKRSRRLQYYKGMANINNAEGKSYIARIDFVYDQEAVKKRYSNRIKNSLIQP